MIIGEDATRIDAVTGFALTAAVGGSAWRVAEDRFISRDGITGARVNTVVGPVSAEDETPRSRYDTHGRTVYLGAVKRVALAESLQPFRETVMSMAKDAAAVGIDRDIYRKQLTAELHERGQPGPGEIPVDWQMARSLYEVALPHRGWWVVIDSPETLNALSDAFAGRWGQLTLGDLHGEDRGLTTEVAQAIRDSMLDDGQEPLGISYPSKTGYGRCLAWWNRRADVSLEPGRDDPTCCSSTNVGVPELHSIMHEWGIVLAR